MGVFFALKQRVERDALVAPMRFALVLVELPVFRRPVGCEPAETVQLVTQFHCW